MLDLAARSRVCPLSAVSADAKQRDQTQLYGQRGRECTCRRKDYAREAENHRLKWFSLPYKCGRAWSETGFETGGTHAPAVGPKVRA